MCDKKIPIKLKDTIYKTIVKPPIIYGSECLAVKYNDTQKQHITEMRTNENIPQKETAEKVWPRVKDVKHAHLCRDREEGEAQEEVAGHIRMA